MKSLCLVLLSVLSLVSCSKSDLVRPKTLRVNIVSEPMTLDPRKARALEDITICRMFFEGLTRIGLDGKVALAQAKEITVSEDGLRYTFQLRNGKWSDGNDVTSYDFAKSWRAILSPEFPTDISYQLYVIKNGSKAKMGDMSLSDIGIYTPNASTLVVELESPTPYFLELCTMSSFFPIPSSSVEENEFWFMEPKTFVGNGPFLLKEWNHQDEMIGVKSPTYWDVDQVGPNEIHLVMVSSETEIRMFEEKQLDWAGSPLSVIPPDSISDLKASGQFKASPLSGTYFYRINTGELIDGKINPLGDPRLRRALALSVDRNAITTHLLQGGQAPALSLVPPGLGLSESGYIETDLEKARSLIHEEHFDPIVISFSVSERNAAIAQAMQRQWEDALGITVELQPLEAKVFYQAVKDRKVQLAAGSWIADFNDPINFLEVFKYKDASTNNTGWESSKYIDLLDRSALCRDQGERMELLREAEAVLMDEMPILPIFHFAINYLEREGVSNIALSPIGQIDFRWAQIDVEPSHQTR